MHEDAIYSHRLRLELSITRVSHVYNQKKTQVGAVKFVSIQKINFTDFLTRIFLAFAAWLSLAALPRAPSAARAPHSPRSLAGTAARRRAPPGSASFLFGQFRGHQRAAGLLVVGAGGRCAGSESHPAISRRKDDGGKTNMTDEADWRMMDEAGWSSCRLILKPNFYVSTTRGPGSAS